MILGWLAQHRAAFALNLQRMFASPFATLLSVLVIGVAISLPLGLYVMLDNLGRIAGSAQGAPEISLFLKDDAEARVRADIEGRLTKHPRVERFRFVPRDEALQQLSARLGMQDAPALLGRNPLPDAFVVSVASSAPEVLDAARAEMQAWPGVALAQHDSDWARKLNALVRLGRDAVWLLAALLGLAVSGVGFNTIRLQVLARRDEIEVSQLLGATPAFIRRPYLYLGALQGVLGALAGWVIVMAALAFINRRVAEIAALYQADFAFAPLPWSSGLTVLALGGVLGWLGAWLAAAQHLAHPAAG